jgi:hypothetical protein
VLQENAPAWVINREKKFLSHILEAGRSDIKVTASGEGLLASSSHGRGQRKSTREKRSNSLPQALHVSINPST